MTYHEKWLVMLIGFWFLMCYFSGVDVSGMHELMLEIVIVGVSDARRCLLVGHISDYGERENLIAEQRAPRYSATTRKSDPDRMMTRVTG